MLTFALSLVEWQVTKYSGRSRRLLNDKSSAKAAGGTGSLEWLVLRRLPTVNRVCRES